jgi:hypothetical protein
MRLRKWLAILSTALLIGSLYFPWVTIESKNIVISGMNATGTNFGKPGLLNLVLAIAFLLLLLINRNWSKVAAFFVSALNIAWAVRNYVVVSTCSGGICPVKHTALYVLLISAILISVFTLLMEVSFQKAPKEPIAEP